MKTTCFFWTYGPTVPERLEDIPGERICDEDGYDESDENFVKNGFAHEHFGNFGVTSIIDPEQEADGLVDHI